MFVCVTVGAVILIPASQCQAAAWTEIVACSHARIAAIPGNDGHQRGRTLFFLSRADRSRSTSTHPAPEHEALVLCC